MWPNPQFKKENLAKVFSCEFCEICRKNVFIKHHRWLFLFTEHFFVNKWLLISGISFKFKTKINGCVLWKLKQNETGCSKVVARIKINKDLFLFKVSFTNTEHSQDSRRRQGTISFQLYDFQSLSKTGRFIYCFASEMTSSQCM